MDYAPNLNEKLHFLRTCSQAELSHLMSTVIPQQCLSTRFLAGLSEDERTICYRATMICWSIFGSKMVPREMQLRAVLADSQGCDALVAAGTGSGKTLPMALCILLDDPSASFITITISPLKRLQVTQESDFNGRFGIHTVTINEDTPHDVHWWKVRILPFISKMFG